MEIRRIETRTGYDLWAEAYDETENPVVWTDAFFLTERLKVKPGERVLDAGCGTGRYFERLLAQGAEVVGVDFSGGMLAVTRRKHPEVGLARVDLQRSWPLADAVFDLVLCAQVGEHLGSLDHVYAEMRRVARPGGRVIFSVYHPAMAAAGKEARFHRGGVEYRLGAWKHVTDDYMDALRRAGFSDVSCEEYAGPPELAEVMPAQAKYVGFPILLIIEASARTE